MNEQQTELDRLIGRAEQHRVALGLTHSQFASRYAQFVGSHKSWESRLLARKWDELKPNTWLTKLRKFSLQLDGAKQDRAIFTSLPIVAHAEYLYQALQTRADDRRCAMLIGTQGTGKSVALRHVARDKRAGTMFLNCNETWKDSRMRISTAIAQGVNASLASSASQTFQNALEVLKGSPITILIDEAHEGGVLLMKLVKTIINETQSRVMLSIYPTAWTRLLNGANDAYAEAQQLLRRTLRPVKSDWNCGINPKDLAAWAKAVEMPAMKVAAEPLLGRIRKHGNYSLLDDALERARLIADERDDDVTPALVCEQINELCGAGREEEK
jgi:type II secretory pathway predicted ATPase ExeA